MNALSPADFVNALRPRLAAWGFDAVPRSFSLAFAIVALLVAGGLGLLGVQVQRLVAARQQLSLAQAAIEQARALEKTFLDAETGQRGYVITGDPAFLQPYESALANAPDIARNVRRLVDDPSQAARLDAIDGLWRSKLAELRQTIEARRGGDIAGATALVAEGAGKRHMDAIRTEFAGLVAVEQGTFSQRLRALENGERVSLAIIAAGLVLALPGLGLALWMLRRDYRAISAEATSQSARALGLTTQGDVLARAVASAETKLRDTSRNLEATLATAPIVVFGQDRELRYTWFKGTALGQSAEWFIGKRDREILPDHDSEDIISNKKAVLETGQPRHFETQVGAGGARRWYDVRCEATRDGDGAIDGLVAVAIDVTDRKAREAHVRLLMRELAHRSKNTLAVVQAMARQTAANTPDPAQFIEKFSNRLLALAATHSILVEDNWKEASMQDLVRLQLGHYEELMGKQIVLGGPPLALPVDAAQSIGLALHELATNSAKYGALSTPSGRVEVTWASKAGAAGEPEASVAWTESGGPPVSPPTRMGFGRNVIERMVARALGGTVDLQYPVEGLRWRVTFPLRPHGGEPA